MKKKLLAMLVSLSMVIALLPVTVLATEDSVTVNNLEELVTAINSGKTNISIVDNNPNDGTGAIVVSSDIDLVPATSVIINANGATDAFHVTGGTLTIQS